MAVCKFCGKEIRWAKTETGKNMPIDPQPYERGNLIVFEKDGALLAFHEANAPLDAATVERWVPHWATCTQRPPRQLDHRG